eukprot:2574614-Prymnesium_polylepis.1
MVGPMRAMSSPTHSCSPAPSRVLWAAVAETTNVRCRGLRAATMACRFVILQDSPPASACALWWYHSVPVVW